uniref:DUF1618 domain-containing protein n=1 Tax=Oryza nivara TaxID=4536 RepID=A0A0E0G021_ORYNI
MDDGDEPVPYVMDEGVLLPLLFPPPLPADDDATGGVSPSWVYLDSLRLPRSRPGASSLRLLPNPRVSPFRNEEVAIVRCSGGARYVIACLMPTIRRPMEFKIRRFDSDVGRWKSTAVSISEPVERDRVLPIPDTASQVVFHCTTKVITLGGTIGWVDLWRGILLCDDVLDQHPPVPYVMDEGVLLPLLFPPPLPADDDATGGVSPSWVYLEDRAYVSPDAVSNSTTAFSTTTTGVSIHVSFCLARPPRLSYLCVHCPRPGDGEGAYRGPPHHYRDITVVVQDSVPTCIKYVEMETRPGDRPPPRQRQPPQHSDDSDSDEEEDVAYYWKANIWSMPIPVGSWEDWQMECTVDVTDIAVDNVRFSELLPKIGNDPEETLRRLVTGFPTLGMDGDVISFLSKINRLDDKGWVISVDLRSKTLQGVAEIDERKYFLFERYYNTSEISKYLIKATGEAGTLVKTGVNSRVSKKKM